MSVFALNFKFDLEASGGDTVSSVIRSTRTPNITSKQKGRLRKEQASNMISSK